MIIYPPFIADTIPAFTTEKVIIPFEMNPAVDKSQITGFELQIKEYQGAKPVAILDLSLTAEAAENIFNTNQVEFQFGNWKPKPLQYYKFQLAWYGDAKSEPSTASIGKCIGDDHTINLIEGNKEKEYIGIYTTPMVSEPVYSYQFILKDNKGNVIEDTGEVRNNTSNDVISEGNRQSSHIFKMKYEQECNLLYSITTINGYTREISIGIEAIEITTGKWSYNLTCDKDNGCIIISHIKDEENTPDNIILERKDNNSGVWEELMANSISDKTKELIWKDFSITQGVEYSYSLRSGNERVIKTITPDFEDMFLSDGERQLKIKFDPKVSSFKDTILEQKLDTIGSAYPFFFRNQQVKYKEIPISGLISYLMDDGDLFTSNKPINKTSQLSMENIAAERNYKLEVYEWLTNGQLKLFRSPTEGNYVIRVMNVSLSPNDTLGRMLHSFSATGYEAADCDLESLIKNNLVNFEPEIVLEEEEIV